MGEEDNGTNALIRQCSSSPHFSSSSLTDCSSDDRFVITKKRRQKLFTGAEHSGLQ
jgi:hypothetical protein